MEATPFTGIGEQMIESLARYLRNAPRTPSGFADAAKAYSASTTVRGSLSAAAAEIHNVEPVSEASKAADRTKMR